LTRSVILITLFSGEHRSADYAVEMIVFASTPSGEVMTVPWVCAVIPFTVSYANPIARRPYPVAMTAARWQDADHPYFLATSGLGKPMVRRGIGSGVAATIRCQSEPLAERGNQSSKGKNVPH
jgi:hypothetical protein